MTVSLNRAQYAATVEKIEKINLRAAKKGLSGKLSVEAGEWILTEKCDHDEDVTCAEAVFGHHVEESIEVEITGEAPKFGDWTFAARVDRLGDTFTLATAPGVEYVSREGIALGECDHCNMDRLRNTTYILTNEVTGQRVQVGSTCIKDFLGWEGHIAWLEGNESEYVEYGPRVEPMFKVERILQLAIASVRMRGFVSTQSYDSMSTREHVALVIGMARLSPKDEEARKALVAAAADVTDEDVAKLTAFIASDDFSGNSTYVDNLKVIVAAGVTEYRQLGLLVSAPQAYAKHLGNVAERAAKVASEWVGTEGQKLTVTVKLERIQTIESQWGTSLLVIGRTENGEIVKTFTTAQWAWDVEEGDTVTLTATVKAHEEYEGKHQTMITRAKKVA